MKRIFFLLFFVWFYKPFSCRAYSVLTHEALIDASWKDYLKPLLLKKYPSATEKELKLAHAYAYGGCIMPDMGYYPFGNKFFTDLTHYVRSGDFINALFDEVENINDYAFSLGALCHYFADSYGHSSGINLIVPMVYEKDFKKYGHSVTYEEDKIAHLRVEFSFDVLQTARGNYASEDYHDLIGFKVSVPVIEKAFIKTYGLKLQDLIPNLGNAIETFRWAVKTLIPEATKIAWSIKKSDIRKQQPLMTEKKFIYHVDRTDYIKEYGKNYERPGFVSGFMSLIIRVFPKIGPLKTLKFHVPNPEEEKVFLNSFDSVLTRYTRFVKQFSSPGLNLTNINYDTRQISVHCEYGLADETYARLLGRLKEKGFSTLTVSLKNNIISYYAGFYSLNKGRNLSKNCKTLQNSIQELQNTRPPKIENGNN
ncbi:MAG TPA: zinc dependent phospholipase C family protein [Flavisolibacter sp.]|nr:zinc dependent phospholipase C family protein [Flavisolibacter sp.]